MADRVLLFATTTGYQTRSFSEAAERLGVRLTLATDRCITLDDPWRDQALPVRFHDEATSVQTIAEAAAEQPFNGILAVGDRPVTLAAAAAEALKLVWHPSDGARASCNKHLARIRWRDAGAPVPWFDAVSGDRDPQSVDPPWPCVVKPLTLSGSRGVIRANTRSDFDTAFHRLRRLLRSPDVRGRRDPDADTILVEQYVPGDEYAVEGLMEHGRTRVLAIFDKPDPLEGPFFEETIYVTPSRASADCQRLVAGAVERAAHLLGLHHGPFHAECRVDADRVVVLEVAARPIGGLCARALRFTGPEGRITFEELLLRHALGQASAGWTREPAASGVLMIPIPSAGVYRGVDGVDDARAEPWVSEVVITAKPDQQLIPLPEGASYLGFIFARADGPGDVERALRAAHARLRFIVDRRLAVVS
jgi:biotin carboxylase